MSSASGIYPAFSSVKRSATVARAASGRAGPRGPLPSRAWPEYPIVDLPLDHPILSSFYEIGEIIQVPNVQLGIMGGRTWERDGVQPAFAYEMGINFIIYSMTR